MATIINGKEISQRIRTHLTKLVAELPSRPRMAVIQVGDNPASSTYVRNKLKACRECGIETVNAHLEEDISQESLLGLIEGFNSSKAFNGILVQLPLPKHIKTEAIIEAIDPLKDVDGFHPVNVGRLTVRSTIPYLHPCTPWGMMHILDTVFPRVGGVSGLRGKVAVVIGQSHIVGRPLSIMLQNEGATVIMCDRSTPDVKTIAKGCDILITATGVHGLINRELVKAIGNPKLCLIDAGIAQLDDRIVGDADPAVYPELWAYTPVPGGVGPVTVAFLIRNVLKAYCIQHGLPIPSMH